MRLIGQKPNYMARLLDYTSGIYPCVPDEGILWGSIPDDPLFGIAAATVSGMTVSAIKDDDFGGWWALGGWFYPKPHKLVASFSGTLDPGDVGSRIRVTVDGMAGGVYGSNVDPVTGPDPASGESNVLSACCAHIVEVDFGFYGGPGFEGDSLACSLAIVEV